jgi:hypothetical protein
MTLYSLKKLFRAPATSRSTETEHEGHTYVFSPSVSALLKKPQFVHVLARGRIVTSGGPELAHRLEKEGYAPILAENGINPTADEAAAPPVAPAGA